jgi:periplasmic protein TonB
MLKIQFVILLLLKGVLVYAQLPQKKIDSVRHQEKEVFYAVDKTAEFPGGFAKFYNFVQKTLKYPSDAKKEGIEGKVFVQFVIDSTGFIRQETIVVTKGLFKSCDEEAIRIITKSPKWIPAYSSHFRKNVPQKYQLPIAFKR